MKTFLIIILIIELIQIIAMFATLITDSMVIFFNENKSIKSKKDVIKYFIPFFWFIPMMVNITNWWKKLK